MDWMWQQEMYLDSRDGIFRRCSRDCKGVAAFEPAMSPSSRKIACFVSIRDVSFSRIRTVQENFSGLLLSEEKSECLLLVSCPAWSCFYWWLVCGCSSTVLKKIPERDRRFGAELKEDFGEQDVSEVYQEIEGDKLKTVPRDYRQITEFIEILTQKALP